MMLAAAAMQAAEALTELSATHQHRANGEQCPCTQSEHALHPANGLRHEEKVSAAVTELRRKHVLKLPLAHGDGRAVVGAAGAAAGCVSTLAGTHLYHDCFGG